jgi:RNA polymerase sigma factor (TIGR02999 family)
MPAPPTTQLVLDLAAGDARAADRLMPLVYEEIRALAAAYMRRERPDHTLQPTALAHEAFARLVDQTRIDWKGRAHFLGVAAQVMRRILVDHARQRLAVKRGGDRRRVTLSTIGDGGEPGRELDLLALDEAMETLGQLNPRHRQVVELRFFGGLDTEAIALVLDVTPQTVRSDWRMARAWLRQRLEKGDGSLFPHRD